MTAGVAAPAEAPPAGPLSIFQIFAAVKREVSAVGKGSENKQQGFMYRGVDAVVNAAAPALDRHGVITAPGLKKLDYAIVEIGSNRTRMAHVQVEVTYTFWGPGGDSFSVTVPGEAMDSGDKATAKAMSVAYRIALLQSLNLPTTDPDPDRDSYERSPARPQQLPDDSPWRGRVAAVQSGDDAERVRDDVRRLVADGQIDGDTARLVKDLLDARMEEVREQQRARRQAGDRAADGQPADDRAASGRAAKWAEQFRGRLARAKVAADIEGMRGEVGRAVIDGILDPSLANELVTEWEKLRGQLKGQMAGAR